MIPVAANFGEKSKLFLLCFIDLDDQQHLISCFVINGSSKAVLFRESVVEYSDIFLRDSKRLKEIAKIFYSALKTRQIFNPM